MEEKQETSRKILDFLEREGVNPEILKEIRAFLEAHPAGEPDRIPTPRYAYYGREVW